MHWSVKESDTTKSVETIIHNVERSRGAISNAQTHELSFRAADGA